MRSSQFTPPHFLLALLLIFFSVSSLSAQAPIQQGSSDYDGNLYHLRNVALGTDASNKNKMLWIKAPEINQAPCLNASVVPNFALYIEGKVNDCPEDGFAGSISRYKPYLTVSTFGNVGVGTDKPEYKFHLQGTGYVSKDFFVDGNVGVGTTSPSEKLHVNGNTTIEGVLTIKDANGDNQFKIDTDGNIRAREIKVDLATIPDYVFAQDYQLMPLEEVADFIKENKHLPNVKSEAEFQEEGSLSLTEMNLKLLEKVEELTLYTLQQQEDINALQAEIKNLKE